jgi:O-antigen ligase
MGRDFESKGITGSWHTAHNTPIQVFVELGVIGGSLYVMMIAACFRTAARAYRMKRTLSGAVLHYPELMAAFASYAASAMFLSHAYIHFTFFVIGLGAYAARVFDVELGPRRGARSPAPAAVPARA